MKTFDFLRNFIYRLMGISPWDSFFGKMWFITAKYVYYGVSISVLSSLYLFCSLTAETFSDYVEAFFYVMICFLLISWFSVFHVSEIKHNELIGDLEAIIEERMTKEYHCHKIYYYTI